jgi:hypothetical protein
MYNMSVRCAPLPSYLYTSRLFSRRVERRQLCWRPGEGDALEDAISSGAGTLGDAASNSLSGAPSTRASRCVNGCTGTNTGTPLAF